MQKLILLKTLVKSQELIKLLTEKAVGIGDHSTEDFYKNFLFKADQFYTKLKSLFREKGLPAVVQHLGAGFHIFLGTEEPINKYRDLNRVDRDLTRKFFNICIENGLYFHTDFTISEAHDELTLNEALGKIDEAIKKLKY